MGSRTAADIAASFSALPAPPGTPPNLDPGNVQLFVNGDWKSASTLVPTASYVSDQRHCLGNSINDQSTWALFNLPVGTVMTLLENRPPIGNDRSVSDLISAGRSLDLVGVGKTVAVDLAKCGMNDCISSFWWRYVDLTMGAIELFADTNYGGNRSVLFFSEWNAGQLYSFNGWWIDNKASSIRWHTLDPRQTVSMWDVATGPDGANSFYSNISGSGGIKEIPDLRDVNFDDQASSFQWDSVNPVLEQIDPIVITSASEQVLDTVQTVVVGSNQSTEDQPITVDVSREDETSMTVESTDQFVAGVSAEWSATVKGDPFGIGAEATTTLSVDFEYTKSATTSKTNTQRIGLKFSQVVNAPPQSSYTAIMTVFMSRVTPQFYRTKATRWYNVPVGDAVFDDTNGLWKRTEQIALRIKGSLASRAEIDIRTKAYSPPEVPK